MCILAGLTEVSRVVVGGAAESEFSEVRNQTGDLPSVDTLTLTEDVQLTHTHTHTHTHTVKVHVVQ